MAITKTFVEFYFPGVLDAANSISEVGSRDPQQVEVPVGVFAFRFFEVLETKEGSITLRSDRLHESCLYYYGGHVLSVDEVRQLPDGQSLVSTMKAKNWARLIQCRTGGIRPFKAGDIHIKID